MICYYFPGNVAHIGNYMYIIGAVLTVYALYLWTYVYSGAVLNFLGRNSMYVLGFHEFIGGIFRNYVEGRLFSKWNGPLVYFILSAIQLAIIGLIIVLVKVLAYRVSIKKNKAWLK